MNRPYSGQVRLYVDRLLGLAGGGVYPADDVTAVAVRSYRTISPLPVPQRAIGCVFSVALSLGLPPVVVSHHRALGFPNAISRIWGPVALLGLSSDGKTPPATAQPTPGIDY